MFCPSKGELYLCPDGRRVDVDDPGIQVPLGNGALVYVLGIDGRREAIAWPIHDPDRIFNAVCLDDAYDRAEDLFLCDPHLRIHIHKYRRFYKEPFGTFSPGIGPPTEDESGPLFFPDVNIVQHLFKLWLIDHRTHVSSLPEAIAHPES